MKKNNVMRNLILLIAVLMTVNLSAQTSKQQKLVRNVQVDLFGSFNEIESITVIADVDFAKIVPHMNRQLLRNRVKVLSENAVKTTLLSIEQSAPNRVDINGSFNTYKSNLVLKLSYDWEIWVGGAKNASVEIIDLSKDGQIVGSMYLKGKKSAENIAYAMITALMNKLK